MICGVYQVDEDADNLLLVDGDDIVVNGNWNLEYARKNNMPLKFLGGIDYKGDYNETLCRFKAGEILTVIKCECCGTESWKETK